jgi:hypothetical protein
MKLVSDTNWGLALVRSNQNVTKRSLLSLSVLLFVSNFAMAQQGSPANSRSWSGTIINSGCTADEAFAEASKCTDNLPGAKLVLYDDTIRQVYDLDPQTQATGHLGDAITVRGALQGNTIHVASLELLTSIGLAVGQKAPVFSARDQFGQEQTLKNLQGPRGTILLFFRSADW